MTAENEKTTGPAVKPPIILCPWLVVLMGLALYGLTLNHWVTFGSLPFVSQITGWDWHPGPLLWRPSLQSPLTFLLTSPLRLLPLAWRPVGLNVFAAVCAALTLAILARSVRLLSHDRTKEQRQREGGEFALLSVRAAFLPAMFAVLMLAAQLTFWENAVAASEEMIDLLVFAFLILCLLEFRISQRETWLSLFAFVYGAGAANNWALIGFFPCFLLAMIWIRRMGFFDWRFALRMTGWGVFGLLLYGLMPVMGAIAHDGSFWDLLHQELGEQHLYLKIPKYYALISAVPTLIPLLFAAINWPSFEGEVNAGAHDITRLLFRVLHIVFLAVGVLMFFDVKLSPSPRRMGMGINGWPGFLSFYYLAALSVGYFSGFVLLVFGKEVAYRWGRATGLPRLINHVVIGLLWVAAFGLPAALFYQNFQHIRDLNNPVVAQFGDEMANGLPAEPAIVLADDPARLALAMGASQRLGLPDRYVFIESGSLTHREYLRYLVDRYPSFRKELMNPDRLPAEIGTAEIGDLLAHLASRQTVYYLHPSFGSYFEQVYLTPRRLGGYLHPYPTNIPPALAAPPPLAPAELAKNQEFWHKLEKDSMATLPELAKKSPDAIRIANYYSQMVNWWGTDLQKMGTELKLPLLLKDANEQFAEAVRLNPENAMARLNQQYNAHLRGIAPTGALINSSDFASQVSSWDMVYNLEGPADVPELDIQIGRGFVQRGAWVQAAHLFQRCLELAPTNADAELDLAKTYVDVGLLDAGLALIREIRSTDTPLEVVRVEALAYAKKNDFNQADRILSDGQHQYPNDVQFPVVMAEFYRRMGYSRLLEGKGDPAKENDSIKWFKKSLAALEVELRLLNEPINVTSRAQEIPAVNLRKAEMQMMLKDYPAAINTLNAMVRQDPENPVPLLNRAISELQSSQLDAAKHDYQALERMVREPSSIVYYGLAQVAQKQNDKPAEIRYDKLYVQYAPTNTAEFTNVFQQLHKLEGR